MIDVAGRNCAIRTFTVPPVGGTTLNPPRSTWRVPPFLNGSLSSAFARRFRSSAFAASCRNWLSAGRTTFAYSAGWVSSIQPSTSSGNSASARS